jgi:hypothetical protein
MTDELDLPEVWPEKLRRHGPIMTVTGALGSLLNRFLHHTKGLCSGAHSRRMRA